MTMLDLLSREEWAELENELNERTGLDANAYDAQGFTFTGLKQWANRLCPSIKEIPAALQSVCSVAHQNLASLARQTGQPVVEECDAGLMKICVPVFAGGQFVGALGACGHLLEDGEVDSFLVHKLTGLPEAEVLKLTEDLPVISRARAEELSTELEARIKGLSAP